MDELHYIALRDQAKARRDEAVSAAKQEYSETISAIDRVWKLVSSTGGSVRSPKRRTRNSGWLTQLVRTAVRQFEGENFTLFNVAKIIEEEYPLNQDRSRQASLSTTLRRLATECNELEVVESGRGPHPTKYHLRANVVDKSDSEEVAKKIGEYIG